MHDLLNSCTQSLSAERDIVRLAEKADMVDFMEREINYR